VGIAFNYWALLEEIDKSRQAPAAEGADAEADGEPGNDAPVAPMVMGAPDFEAKARLLERLVYEPWPFEASGTLLQNMVQFILQNRATAVPFAAYLSNGSPARKLIAAQLQFSLEGIFARAVEQPDAPATVERALREVQNGAMAARDALEEISKGNDKILAARAFALMAERAAGSRAWDEAAGHLRAAVALEPNDANLRVALADILAASGKTPEALVVRDEMLRSLPRDGDTLRRIAALSLKLGAAADAARLAAQSQSLEQVARNTTPARLEIASFVLARALYASGKTGGADEVYRNLAKPQWGTADRVAALLDWQNTLRAAGKEAEAERLQPQLDALGATEEEVEQARALLETLA
ncbi:MAG TPA: hypothetical protein VF719_07685, partial [Abditibacteriaceae bacterium]